MSEMVERVAEVLKPFFSSADRAHGEHRQAARSAIEAMREPNNEMLFQGVMAQESDDPTVQGIYQAMIDAALA